MTNNYVDKIVKEAMEFTGTDNLDDCLKKLKEMEK